jgi:hypothetical protein
MQGSSILAVKDAWAGPKVQRLLFFLLGCTWQKEALLEKSHRRDRKEEKTEPLPDLLMPV